ncbi:MAG: hypothetical protein ACXWJ8_13440 [Xanthobacteraceae bacterium]
MIAARDDYKVEFREEALFADTALTWRKESSNENDPYFNIVRFVQTVLSKKAQKPFKIEFFDARPGEKPAYGLRRAWT